MDILLGSDPEMFVKRDGEFISAHGMIEGTKKKPYVVRHGAVQVDGMALEYNTDPATTLKQWETAHVAVQEQMLGLIAPDLTLEATPTAFFSKEVFNTAPEEAKILGCEPDYNAYTERINGKPNGKVKFRTGAGHIHIGWTDDADIKSDFHLGECYALAKMLDFHLGIPSMLLDGDTNRRQLYGAAGCFRPKSYGMEYRTLSNFWIDTPELREWAYKATIRGIYAAHDHRHDYSFVTRHTIDTNDMAKAKQLTTNFELEVPNGFQI